VPSLLSMITAQLKHCAAPQPNLVIRNMPQRGETDLEMAVRRVAEARRTVEQQRRLIARLKKAEKPTLHQRQTLLVLESILQITKVYERMIREEAHAATVETDRKARRKIRKCQRDQCRGKLSAGPSWRPQDRFQLPELRSIIQACARSKIGRQSTRVSGRPLRSMQTTVGANGRRFSAEIFHDPKAPLRQRVDWRFPVALPRLTNSLSRNLHGRCAKPCGVSAQ
jgi:hypothetical protein